MINYYFGLPGVGKTTYLVATALRENDRINKGKSKFDRVLVNVRMSVPSGVDSHIYYFSNEDFGYYDMSNSLILFDEAQMLFDNRDYKNLTKERRDFLMLHRHYKTAIYFFNQTYDSVDKKIRLITNNVYVMKRSFLTGKTTARKLKYLMYIPKKPKRGDVVQNNNGEIEMRYYQSGIFEHLFSMLIWERPVKLRRYWSCFDSFDAPPLTVKEFELL